MARSCGIRIGPRRFELVVIDGSVKKHKISAYHVGEFSPEDAAAFAEGDVSGVAASLKEAAKAHRIPSENIGIVMATDRAAFRRLALPFSDKAKIEQVLKFEIEGELPQFDIDDVVVDYHVMSQNDKGAELLVSAVPKSDVQTVIAACDKAGIEPLEVELEATATVNAAFTADMCHIDDAQLLVHVGEHSTCVAVVAGAELREFRVIHIGAMTHLGHELEGAGGSEDVELDDDGEDADGIEPLDGLAAQRKVDQAVKRIKREIGRTISAARTPQAIEAVYVAGTELPGLVSSDILDVPVYVLDCFDGDAGQPADGFGQLVAAYGGAVRQLGGGHLKPSLRRDELRYTGTWERIEFPVAFAALMLATFLGLMNIIQMRKLYWMNQTSAYDRLVNVNYRALGSAANPNDIKTGILKIAEPLDPDVEGYDKLKELYDDFVALRERADRYRDAKSVKGIPGELAPPIEELQRIENEYQDLKDLAESLGSSGGDVELPPNVFFAVTYMTDVLRQNQAWRPSIRKIEANVEKPKKREGTTKELVKVELDATFFGKDPVEASRHFQDFRKALDSKPWCTSTEEPALDSLPDGDGIFFSRFTILVDPSMGAAGRPTQ